MRSLAEYFSEYLLLLMYWEPHTGITLTADTFSVNRIFKLRNHLHLVNNMDDGSPEDKILKMRPLLNRIRETSQSEKRRKGKSTGIRSEHKHRGSGGSIVMRLSEHIPQVCRYKIYFDNYFTSMSLVLELLKKKSFSIETIRPNWLQKCPLKSECELKKEGRGSVNVCVTTEEDLCVVRWLGNSAVTLPSSYLGAEIIGKVNKWSAAQKQHLEVTRPAIVKDYCVFMGGIDKIDFLISLYRICMETKKWPIKVTFHMVDLSICN
ncbi:piggyBac transposable element-derived protein 1-like [Schistocerca nitens]|uniref:piggyBac transposable element-derived protein 1-like n=1 Tax=Schistocerca nitens TaxID=7011 RepID=UPI002117580B|nr:piggyBac transposable element-derived protein 1-like [Schistocerca nitens]